MVSLASTTALVHVLVLSPYLWWPMRALTGFCFATLYMIIESWINEKATNETRGFVFSVYTIINLTVITVGQMMLTLTDPASFVLFALASVLISLAAIPVALTTAEAPAPPANIRIRPRHLYKMSPVGFVGALVVGLANGPFWSLGPVFAQTSGLSTTGIALFMSTAVIAGAALQWPLGAWSDRWDRRKVILVVCVGAAIAGMGMFALSGTWKWGMLVFAIGFGAFAMPLYALCAAHMNDHVEKGGFVEASSGLLLLYAVGAVTGPLVASSAMRLIGTPGLFGPRSRKPRSWPKPWPRSNTRRQNQPSRRRTQSSIPNRPSRIATTIGNPNRLPAPGMPPTLMPSRPVTKPSGRNITATIESR
jgi:MFS family permease